MTAPDHLVAGQVPPCRVWLDGAEQKMVSEASISGGWLIRAKLDAEGHVYAEGDEIATEKLFGVVTAEFMETENV